MSLTSLVTAVAVLLGADGTPPALKLSLDACRVSGRDRVMLIATVHNPGTADVAALAPGWRLQCDTEFRCNAGADDCAAVPSAARAELGRGRKPGRSVLPNLRLLSAGARASDVVLLGDDQWHGAGQYRWVCTNDASLVPDDRIGFFLGLWSLELDGGWSGALAASPTDSEAAAVALHVTDAPRTLAPLPQGEPPAGDVRLEINSCEQQLDGGGFRMWLLPTLLAAEPKKDDPMLVIPPGVGAWGSCTVRDDRGRVVHGPGVTPPPAASWGLAQLERGRLLGALPLPELPPGKYELECTYRNSGTAEVLDDMLERLGGKLDGGMAKRIAAASFDGELTARATLTLSPAAAAVSASPAAAEKKTKPGHRGARGRKK